MTSRPDSPPIAAAGFRLRLFLGTLLVVSAVLALAFALALRNAREDVRRELTHAFQREVAAVQLRREMRHAALVERSRALARKPRIHAALEDNALDLLYPSAQDELRDLMAPPDDHQEGALHAQFYRFLDESGAVIAPNDAASVGPLTAEESARLALPAISAQTQSGVLRRAGPDGPSFEEIMATPVFSTETGTPIAALVLGFAPSATPPGDGELQTGIWSEGVLYLPGVSPGAHAMLGEKMGRLPADFPAIDGETVVLEGAPHLLFALRLNAGSLYPPVHEVVLLPLSALTTAEQRLIRRFAIAWAGLFAVALVAAHLLSVRFARPVAVLAHDSALHQHERRRAEEALETTHEELQRSARFSADASHQLKTPVTVLRVGLEELLAGEKLTDEVREEVSGLVHQTFRLTSVIEDLLLLSRMDAGRLKLELTEVNLGRLLESAIDDVSALPDDDRELEIETDIPPRLPIRAEARYASIILQNLLENARKYNRPQGRIRLQAHAQDGFAVVRVGNTGPGIPAAAQEHVFERFHRGTSGENVPGHGLGLNLARQLARLHEGEVRLLASGEDWTEFELRFRLADVPLRPDAA